MRLRFASYSATRNMRCLLVLLASVVAVSAHLCMFSPPQRGSLQGFNMKGANDCGLVQPQCGGRSRGKNPVTLMMGKNFTVTFQKNLDHCLNATPGHFTVMFGMENNLRRLATVPDMCEPSLTLYSVNVTIPMGSKATNYILQTKYMTNNPSVPPVFYQCGDVMLK